MTRKGFALFAVAVVLAGVAITGGTWASTRSTGDGSAKATTAGYGAGMMGRAEVAGNAGMMGGAKMMGGSYGAAGDGRRVASLDGARQRAQAFADRLGLHAGEVMSFSNGYYVELVTADRQGATEVLVDPATGGVTVEYGPAMMWNVTYGMHPGAVAATARVSPADAVTSAQRWLDEQRLGLTANNAEQFPGYYTLHTLSGATIAGMMSVNSSTGAVWYHTWHGQFIAMSEE
jgi:hypothetical protein